MFKTLLAGTKLNLCQNKKRNRYIEKEDFIGVGQISEPLLAKMWLRVRLRPPDAGNTFRRSSCKNRPGLTTCPNHFQPMTPRLRTALFTLLSQKDASCYLEKTPLSLINRRLALSSSGCLFGHLSFVTVPKLPSRQENGCCLH